MTANNCNYTGTGLQFLFVQADTTGTNVGLNMNNNTVDGGGNASRGLSVDLQSTSNFLGLISGNNVTGGVLDGMLVAVGGSCTARMRFTNNRTLGNLVDRGLVIAHIGAAAPVTGCIFTNNTSDEFSLFQNNLGTFSVGEFPLFSAASGNIGTLNTAGGTITNVTSVSLGIP